MLPCRDSLRPRLHCPPCTPDINSALKQRDVIYEVNYLEKDIHTGRHEREKEALTFRNRILRQDVKDPVHAENKKGCKERGRVAVVYADRNKINGQKRFKKIDNIGVDDIGQIY